MENSEKRDITKLGLSLGLSGIGLALGIPPIEMLATFAVGVGVNFLSSVGEQGVDAWAQSWSERVLDQDLEWALAEALKLAAKDVQETLKEKYPGYNKWPRSKYESSKNARRRLEYLEGNSHKALREWLKEPERRAEIVALMKEEKEPLAAALVARTEADFRDKGAFLDYQIDRELAERWQLHFWDVLKGDDKAWRAGEQLWRGVLLQSLLEIAEQNQQQFEAIKAELATLKIEPAKDQDAHSLKLFQAALEKVLTRSLAELRDDLAVMGQKTDALLGISGKTLETVERIEDKINRLPQSPPVTPPPPPPFMAPKPPKQFVQRPAEFNELVELLLASDSQRTVAITTALQGGGGFGKTTLAQAICHYKRIIEAFPDGILWVTVGQTPSLVELLSVQIKLFAPTESYADINAAAARLRALLTGKRVFLVLDDVWQEHHARPFIMKESTTCAHLITTRQQEIARWLQAETVDVNEMKTSQAVALLVKWLAETKALEKLAADEELMTQLHRLAEYLGEWPLLLELVAAQLRDFVQRRGKTLSQAIQDVQKRLKRRGFTAFDRTREQERNRAISISLGVSLDELDALCEEALGEHTSWRQRYLELAIFPEDVDIPFTTIFKLWQGTASFDDVDSEDALYAIQNLSLFTRYDADKQTVRLHDVIRAYLAQQQVKTLPDLHHQFLTAYGLNNWADLPADERYLWQHLAYHLHEAKRGDELRALLLDFAWMDAKLHATDINALLADYDKLPDDNVAQKMQRVLRQASHILARDKNQLASQLWARLTEDERTQLTPINQAGPWLRPLHPTLRTHPALVRSLAGHTSYILGVAVSADERWALSASNDGTVKVWDLATGQERLTFKGHTFSVTGVAVSADGRWALSASWDQTVKVWDLATGQERLSFKGHTNLVNEVAVSADGRWALSASHDRTVKVWDLTTGQERFTFKGHTDYVFGVAVSADGRWVLSASSDKTVKVWELATGQEHLTFKGHTKGVNGVAVSADGRWALSASNDQTVKVWELATGQERLTFKGHTSRVHGVVVSADGRWALSGSNDQTVKVWELATGQERLTFKGHTSRVNGVAVSADGHWALSASYDQTVKVWDLAILRQAAEVRLRQAQSNWGQERLTFEGHAGEVTGVAVSVNRRWALSGSNDQTVKVWDLATGQEYLTFKGHTDIVSGVAVSADGRWALSASWDQTVKVWELATGQERLTFKGHTDIVSEVAVSADERWALSASYDRTMKVWDLATGQERLSLAGHTSWVTGVAVSTDGRWALSASDDKTVKVWKLATGQERLSLADHTSVVSGVAVSADGRWALSASWDQTVKVWDLATGQERLTFRGHTSVVSGVAVSADGRWALSASFDQTVKVWSLADGRVLATFDAGEGLTCCAMTPDGRMIVAGGRSGRVYFWWLEGL